MNPIIFGLIVAGMMMLYQAYEVPAKGKLDCLAGDYKTPVTCDERALPAEPVIFATAPGDYGLSLEPSNPKPIVGVFLIACHNGTFVCSDNGAEFHRCANWELAEQGLKNPRFSGGKCLTDKGK